MTDKSNLDYYSLYEGNNVDIEEKEKELCWNIIDRDGSVRNVFKLNYPVNDNLASLVKKKNLTFTEFEKEIREILHWQLWSRTEYEIILSQWAGKEWVHKIDVYTQIMLNWKHFIKYCWENKDLMKKLK